MIETKTRIPKRQDQKTIRNVIAKINRRLDDSTLTKEEWLECVRSIVQLAKQLETPRIRNIAQSSKASGPDSTLF